MGWTDEREERRRREDKNQKALHDERRGEKRPSMNKRKTGRVNTGQTRKRMTRLTWQWNKDKKSKKTREASGRRKDRGGSTERALKSVRGREERESKKWRTEQNNVKTKCQGEAESSGYEKRNMKKITHTKGNKRRGQRI